MSNNPTFCNFTPTEPARQRFMMGTRPGANINATLTSGAAYESVSKRNLCRGAIKPILIDTICESIVGSKIIEPTPARTANTYGRGGASSDDFSSISSCVSFAKDNTESACFSSSEALISLGVWPFRRLAKCEIVNNAKVGIIAYMNINSSARSTHSSFAYTTSSEDLVPFISNCTLCFKLACRHKEYVNIKGKATKFGKVIEMWNQGRNEGSGAASGARTKNDKSIFSSVDDTAATTTIHTSFNRSIEIPPPSRTKNMDGIITHFNNRESVFIPAVSSTSYLTQTTPMRMIKNTGRIELKLSQNTSATLVIFPQPQYSSK
mmetsp:Transcript_45154/g.72333  ORF Transcript_45154/g.72333 Transcript_45154/m.72333 type:complete len:321 (-) Transcript_45154:344-1306(-)